MIMNLITQKMKTRICISVILLALLTIISCTGVYENGQEMVAEAQPYVDEISVDELKDKIINGEAFYLLDVRTPEEYGSGYINDHFKYDFYFRPINIPRGILEFQISDEGFWEPLFEDMPDKDSTEIVICCKSGARGVLASETLLILGYKNVKNLTGGYMAWDPNQEKRVKIEEESGCGG